MTDYRKRFDLTGKTAVVLGAASGIGKSSAEALAGLGARVIREPGGGAAPAFQFCNRGHVHIEIPCRLAAL